MNYEEFLDKLMKSTEESNKRKARELHHNAFIKNKKLFVNGDEFTPQQLAAEEESTDEEQEEIGVSQEKEVIVHRRADQVIATDEAAERQPKGKKGDDIFVTEVVANTSKRKIVQCTESAPKLRSRHNSNSGTISNKKSVSSASEFKEK
nr:unnamed protein product [Callosobruchus chinensis]